MQLKLKLIELVPISRISGGLVIDVCTGRLSLNTSTKGIDENRRRFLFLTRFLLFCLILKINERSANVTYLEHSLSLHSLERTKWINDTKQKRTQIKRKITQENWTKQNSRPSSDFFLCFLFFFLFSFNDVRLINGNCLICVMRF